ncbi:MAG: class I SAM-dependent rRNA methyltransferase [Chloroflexota bacterium]
MQFVAEYRLLDCGLGRRLEAFGDLVVDRPAPTADQPRRAPARWSGAVGYRGGRGWATADADRPERASAQVGIAGVAMTVRLGPGGQVGVFPEHAGHAQWLRDAVSARSAEGRDDRLEILNLFAHTGLLSLVAAAAGARVAHVDASRPAVQTARQNAEHSALGDRPIRWIVDDAVAFVRREGRRGRRYAGFIIDPPSYGHGARGGQGGGWHFESGIDGLLDACRVVARPDAFWILSTHTPGWDPDRLAGLLERHSAEGHSEVDSRPLQILAESGAVLGLGAVALVDPLRTHPR